MENHQWNHEYADKIDKSESLFVFVRASHLWEVIDMDDIMEIQIELTSLFVWTIHLWESIRRIKIMQTCTKYNELWPAPEYIAH